MTYKINYDRDKTGIIFAFIAVFLWATLGVGFKLAVSRLDSFIVAVYIGFFSTLFLFINLLIRKKLGGLLKLFKKNWLFFIATGILGLGIQQILYLKGYQLLPASEVIILFYLYPLLMILIAKFIFKEKTSFFSYFFVILGFLGLYISISQGNLFQINLSTGLIVTLLASLSWALFSLLIKYKKFDADIGMFLFNVFGLLFLISITPFWGFSFDVSLSEISGMIYLGIFPTAIAFIIWDKALQLTKTHICSNIALLTPVISLILIGIILKEKINSYQIIGLTLILSSVFLDIKFRMKSA